MTNLKAEETGDPTVDEPHHLRSQHRIFFAAEAPSQWLPKTSKTAVNYACVA